MKKLLPSIIGLALFGSFAASAGAFAAASEQEAAANQTFQCMMNWAADSIECKSRKTDGPCTTKYQGDHASVEEAKTRCEEISGVTLGISGVLSCDPCWAVGTAESPVERCKKACDVINLVCIARCKRGDKNCMNRCNQELGKCLKDCEK